MDREKAETISITLNNRGIKVYSECPNRCRYPDSCDHWIINVENEKDQNEVNRFIQSMNS